MKRVLILVLLLSQGLQWSLAQDLNLREEVLRINSLKDDSAKLQGLADVAAKLQAQSADYVTQWSVQKIDDSMGNRTVFLITTVDKNNQDARMTIQYVKNLRESQDRVTIFVDNVSDWKFNSGVQPVDLRFGSGPAVQHENWAYSKDAKQMVMSFPDKKLALMAINDDLTVTFVAAYNQTKVSRAFDIYGLQKALATYDLDLRTMTAVAARGN